MKLRCLALAALFVSPVAAEAAQVKFLTDSHGTTGGGEFVFEVTSGPLGLAAQGTRFTTFCVEYNEHVSPGATYTAVLNTGAVKGGVSGQTTNNFDPLSPKTAFLFTQFALGTLSGYNFNGGSLQAASANALQAAIWVLEDEFASVNNVPNTTSAERTLATTFINLANASGWNTLGDVRVMNLFSGTNNQNHHQDQLVHIPGPTPTPGIVVPVPAAGVAGLMLLGGLGIKRRFATR